MSDEPTIDPATDERPLRIEQLAKQLLPTWPNRPDGTRPTLAFVFRYVRRYVVKGFRGVFVPAQKRGSLWIVTRAGWERFLVEKHAPKPPRPSPAKVRAKVRAQQRREEAKADRARYVAACERAWGAVVEFQRECRARRQRRGPSMPAVRLHKASNRAYVWVDGKAKYLGTWGTPEASAAYERFTEDWQATKR